MPCGAGFTSRRVCRMDGERFVPSEKAKAMAKRWEADDGDVKSADDALDRVLDSGMQLVDDDAVTVKHSKMYVTTRLS